MSAIAPLCLRLTMLSASKALVAMAKRSECTSYREEAATVIAALTTDTSRGATFVTTVAAQGLLRVSQDGSEPARTTASAALLALGPQLFGTFAEPLQGLPLFSERLFGLMHAPICCAPRCMYATLNRVQGLQLAERALLALYQRYLRSEPPEQLKSVFKEVVKMAYNLKYAVMSVMLTVRSASGAVLGAGSSSRETPRPRV